MHGSRAAPSSSTSVAVHPALTGVRVLLLEDAVGELMMFNESYWLVHRVRTNNELHFRNRRFYSPSRTVGVTEPDGFFRTGSMLEPVVCAIVSIDPAVIAAAAYELGGASLPRFGGMLTLAPPRVYAALGELVAALRRPSEPELEVQSRLAALLPSVLARATEGATPELQTGRVPVTVRRARDMIHDHFGEKLSLEMLAAEARMSPFALVHAFTNHYGIAPHAYQNQLRLSRARSLLEMGSSPSRAALDAGFYDQSHFTRLFKRSVGITPSAYASVFRRR